MPKAKPYSGPIDAAISTQLLNSSGEHVDGVLLGDALEASVTHLADLVTRANAFLKHSEFAKIVADHYALKVNRRGRRSIAVLPSGEPILQIGYEEGPARPVAKATRRKLPRLKVLRAEADALGVSIEKFGIKRKEISDYLEKIRVERKSSRRTSNPEDPGPMGAGPDETKLIPAAETPLLAPRRRAPTAVTVPETSPMVVDEASPQAATRPETRRSLRQMVEQSKDIDIAGLLTSDPPD